ncbi:MAG: aminoglycoside phosphotransferase family protein [Kineosporiaceae bacterium]
MLDGEVARGGVNEVERRGQLVLRPVGSWTPAVHRLLRRFEEAGFAGAPRAHGVDADGRERLDFVPGVVAGFPLPPQLRGDDVLVAFARLLRAAHDASVPLASSPGPWFLPGRPPAEVVCHGDCAPYNTVVRDGVPVALIDWDTAHPGPRLWDVAYAAYRWAPLVSPLNAEGFGSAGERRRRALVLVAGYGLDVTFEALCEAAADRLDAMVGLLRARAASGDAAFAAHVARGDDVLYERDAAWLRRADPPQGR